MKTPAGKECKHYYQDYNRGRNIQECRLIKANSQSLRWRPVYCETCSVPDILNANASPNLELNLIVQPRFLGLGRKLELSAQCIKHRVTVTDPFVGCPLCNQERPGLDVFWKALDEDEIDTRSE